MIELGNLWELKKIGGKSREASNELDKNTN